MSLLLLFGGPAAPGVPIIVSWTVGEAGCTFKIYVSPINEPINFGSRASPGPFGPTAVDATSLNIGPLTGAAAVDVTSNYATLVASFDSEVASLGVTFDAGESGWLAALAARETALLAAIAVWETALGKTLDDAKAALRLQVDVLEAAEDAVADDAMSTADWKTYTGLFYGAFLNFVSALLEGFSGRYVLPGGHAPGGASAGGSTITGASPDGSTGASGASFQQSLKAAGEPFVRSGYRRFVVRASKGGIEETGDIPFVLEIDGTNTPLAPRPNAAQIQQITFSSGNVTVRAGVNEDNASVAATIIDIYVVSKGAAITLSSPSASGTLPAANGSYHEISTSFAMPGNGWFDIVAVSRTAAGVRQEAYTRFSKYYSSAVPTGVASISAKVLRGSGVRPEEAS